MNELKEYKFKVDEDEVKFSPRTPLTEEIKKDILQDLNLKIGEDVENLTNVYEFENELVLRRDELRGFLNAANNEVPTKLSTAIEKAEVNSKHIENLKERSETLKKKTEAFLERNGPVLGELDKRFTALHKLQEMLTYFKSYTKVEEISNQLKQCKDDEQMVTLYNQLMEMCESCKNPHLLAYVKEYTHYWHNVLRDHLTKNYEEVMKTMRWPFSSEDKSPVPNDILLKFSNITKYLFMIREPDAVIQEVQFYEERHVVREPSLPVKILLRPLKKRFMFHFTGTRQTARIDRPEWFLTQTLAWIRDHQDFVRSHVQPVADKLRMRHVHAVAEFNGGLVSLAAERLHTVLALYQSHGLKGEIVDVDAAFAHAVDETLGFHRELKAVTEDHIDIVLSVLTKAETFVRWLAVEKKYALTKMDETLDNDQWIEAVATGVGSAVGSVLWVPRGADWFTSLLKTMEDRYFTLPQPGHRLQFLELQLELLDEFRIRLTQLLGVAVHSVDSDTFLVAAPNLLIAIINTAHHVRTVLLLWAHSLQYLQLYYYRTQFHNYTRQHHQDDSEHSSVADEEVEEDDNKDDREQTDDDETILLKDVEVRAQKLAISDVSKQTTTIGKTAADQSQPAGLDPTGEEGAAFGEAPELLANLRDTGLASVVEHIMFEFKATTRDYKKQKWHAMPTLEQKSLSVSPSLCGPLAALCARKAACSQALAPRLAETLRMLLAREVDDYLFEEVCLPSWFNTGGALQLTYDTMRCLMPIFVPSVNSDLVKISLMPRLVEGCRLLNLDYEDARKLRRVMRQPLHSTIEEAQLQRSSYLKPDEVRQILDHRTDMKDITPDFVMELF